jgi:hypothetical protein
LPTGSGGLRNMAPYEDDPLQVKAELRASLLGRLSVEKTM